VIGIEIDMASSNLITCPKCAEQIQPSAILCRFCGTKIQKKRSFGNIIGIFGAAIVGLIVVTQIATPDDLPKKVIKLSPARQLECTNTLSDEKQKSFIIKRPANNRLDVDDVVWGLAMADDKRAVMSLLACSAFGRTPDQMDNSQYVVIYGARSGKRLAMLSSVGVTFE
jgi:hypothetical protein